MIIGENNILSFFKLMLINKKMGKSIFGVVFLRLLFSDTLKGLSKNRLKNVKIVYNKGGE